MALPKIVKLDLFIGKYLPKNGFNGSVAIIGNYAGKNLGDEAILHTMVRDLRASYPDINIFVPSRHPEIVSSLHGVTGVAPSPKEVLATMLKSKVIIIGGGTIYSEYAGPFIWLLPFFGILARILGKAVVYYAIGFDSTTPLLMKVLAKLSFLFSNKVSMRDQKSIKINPIINLIKRIELIQDPVFHLDMYLDFQKKRKEDRIGFGINPVKDPNINKKLAHEYAALIKKLLKLYPGMQISMINFYDDRDSDFAKQILMEIKNTKSRLEIYSWKDIQDAVNQITSARLFVAGRLHASILASLTATSTVHIAYASKNEEILQQLGINDYHNVKYLSSKSLLTQIDAKLKV